MPLILPTLFRTAEDLVVDVHANGEPLDNAVRRAFARGAAAVRIGPNDDPAGERRARLFADTFAEILTAGAYRDALRATAGLRASERSTRERGGIVFVENAADTVVVGAVFPVLPEIVLGPGEVFAWVHDLPIGASGNYLGAYAGLVKSDASVLTVHLRPEPFVGARVFVFGAPGQSREVALFGRSRGEGTLVTFADEPRSYDLAESQIIALSEERAGATCLPELPEQSLLPTTLGSDFLLWPDGALEFLDDWPEAPETAEEGWYAATVSMPAAASARLDLERGSVEALWIDGVPALPDDLALSAGERRLLLYTRTGFSGALLLPDGACWLKELTRWRRHYSS